MEDNSSESTQLIINVEVTASPQPQLQAQPQPTCSRVLVAWVIEKFGEQIATAVADEDGSYVVNIPYPEESVYDDCVKHDTKFIPMACLANPRMITNNIYPQLVKHNSALASTHTFRVESEPESVKILVRPRPAAKAAASEAVSAPVDRYQSILNTATERGHPFPIPDVVRAALAAAVPHQEGLTRSVVYKVGSDKEGVDLFCRRLGLKSVLTKDQPKQSGLIKFRIFAEDKPDFAAKTAKRGGGGAPKRGGGTSA